MGHAEAREPSLPVLDVAAPISTDLFSFLQLPREIRDSIYRYVLMRPESPLTVTPENFYCYSESDVWPHKNPAPIWDRGRPTCLFRVNRQFSAEASEVLYSKFPVHFEQTIDASFNNFPLPDNMLLRNRSLVKSVGFTIIVSATQSTFTIREEEKVRQDLQTVLKWLPNVRRVDLAFKLCDRYRRVPQVKDIVDRLVQIASPLQDVAHLTLHCGSNVWTRKRKRIVVEVHQALARCELVKLCPRMDCNLTGTRLPILP